jgi:transposase
MSTTYPSNLSDAEWDCLQRFLPPRSSLGKLRRHSLRSVFGALCHLLVSHSSFTGVVVMGTVATASTPASQSRVAVAPHRVGIAIVRIVRNCPAGTTPEWCTAGAREVHTLRGSISMEP